MEIANILVASGNFYPIIYSLLYFNFLSWYSIIMIFSNASVSFFMHLGETEHGRTGIYPYSLYFSRFLFLNTIFTTVNAFTVIYIYYLQDNLLELALHGGFAGLNIILAERVFHNDKVKWIICHTIWHIICYHILVSTLIIE